MESVEQRQQRTDQSEKDALQRKISPGSVPESLQDTNEDSDKIVALPPPIDGAVMDALIYLRENMSPEEVLNMILLRNRVSRQEAIQVINQVLNTTKPKAEERKQDEKLSGDD